MGEVYRARDTRLGREAALKPPRTLELEARAVATLNHPNIAAVFDIGHADGLPSYMVTERVDGESLGGSKVTLCWLRSEPRASASGFTIASAIIIDAGIALPSSMKILAAQRPQLVFSHCFHVDTCRLTRSAAIPLDANRQS